jgi:cellulose synthase/poly-beta-1,6-N-acetylglucosamine synthase-like glycosyltransferase
LAGHTRRRASHPESEIQQKVALLVPSYREDEIIISSVRHHLEQDYLPSNFDVVVISDSLRKATIESIRSMGAIVVEVSFDKSTKAKSLNAAFDQLPEGYEIALICDADNILEKQFLKKLNNAYNSGHQYIQAKRVAKNLDSPYAVLDGASEIINNHLFRRGHNALGLSSGLIGSGMAFNYLEIKKRFKSIEAVGGFDKILQLQLVKEKCKIYYLDNALVFDEKISSPHAFENQRKRWLNSQFKYLFKYFIPGVKQLFLGNIDYFNLSVFYYIFPPRVLALGAMGTLAIFMTVLSLFFDINPMYWWIVLIIYIFSLLICLPLNFFNKSFFNALPSIPGAFVRMFSLLFRLKGADKSFIHTSHSKGEVSTNLYNHESGV